ncbi:MAG: hypothetical protein IPO08_23265 [Xanthomonadales bacterium]|nr:hypothetical protein [Xanthomonadales bacterium]
MAPQDLKILAADFMSHPLSRSVSDCEKAGEAMFDAATQIDRLHARIADLESAGHKTAMELECLLLDCKDTVVVSKWFDTGMAALSAWQELFEYQGPRLGD